MLKIGGILKARMFSKDIRQKELADMMGLDQRTISNYCNDINFPSLDTLSKLCSILEIDINHLLKLKTNENDELLIQNDLEMRLVQEFRKLPPEKQREFIKGCLCIMQLIE